MHYFKQKIKIATILILVRLRVTDLKINLLIMDNQQNQFNVELSEEIADGIYSNLAVISHSPTEFVLDYIRVMPNMPKAKVVSRIILTPEHAKRLLQALNDNVRRYEQQFGVIAENNSGGFPPMNFNTPTAMA